MKKKASPFIPELLKRYAKGLDNGATESYSKLSRFFLGGRPWRFLSRPLYFTLVGTPFQAQPPTFQRQFDKMQISFVSLTTIGFSAYPSFFRSSSVVSPLASVSMLRSRVICMLKPLLIFACIALHGTDQKTSSFPPPFLTTGIRSPPPSSVFPLHLVDGCTSNASMRVRSHDRSISATDAFIRPGNSTYRAHRGFNLYANLKPVRLIADSYHFSRQLFSFFIRPYFHGFTANLFFAATRERDPETRVTTNARLMMNYLYNVR